MATWADEYLKMIDDCEKIDSRLSEWECNFLESIYDRLQEDKPLMPKQTETLDKIWEKATRNG